MVDRASLEELENNSQVCLGAVEVQSASETFLFKNNAAPGSSPDSRKYDPYLVIRSLKNSQK